MARIRTIEPKIHLPENVSESDVGCWLYCLSESEAEGVVKVGVTTNYSKRLSSLQGGNHRKLVINWLLGLTSKDSALDIEQHVLMRFRPSIYGISTDKKLCSEWIRSNPEEVLDYAIPMADAIEGVG